MIHKVYANKEQFEVIKFQKGLNIILADSEMSEEQNTRNGVGKTTLIKIIHFCLGATLTKDLLPTEHLKDWIFTIELDISKEKIKASRSINDSNKIVIEGNFDELPIKPELDSDKGILFYKLKNWNELLGKVLFGIEPENSPYSPSFRKIIPYFVRREEDCISAFKQSSTKYKNVDWKVCTAFCLGLNWKLISKYQELSEESKELNNRENFLKKGLGLSRGELEAVRLRLEKEVVTRKEELDTFKVHKSYESIEKMANTLTNEIHELTNKNMILSQKLQKYEESVKYEQDPDPLAVEKLYEEAGMFFPNNVKKRLVDAKNFHKSLIKNRKEFLQSEIMETKIQISHNKENVHIKTNEKVRYMDILKNYGALREYTELHDIYSEKKQKLEDIKLKINEFDNIKREKSRNNEDKLILDTKFPIDYNQSRPNWEKAVELFSENSKDLYGIPGNLIIDVIEEKGYDFDIDIPRSKSSGIKKMTIFCYDLMLVELFSSKNKIDFLIHDSTIFEGVDSRQYASALKLANKKGMEKGFQYICTINSDTIPEEFLGDLNINNSVRLKLDDKDPHGSILGFEF